MTDIAKIENQVATQKLILPQTHHDRDNESDALIAVISRAAQNPNVDVDKLQKLLDMQERIMEKKAEIAFNEALSRLAPKLPRVKKNGSVEYPVDKNNPKGAKETAFRFATYEDIDRAIRPILAEEGFSLSFTTIPRPGEGGGTITRGRLSHVLGAFREADFAAALDTSGGKNNIQAMKSSFRYGQRAVVEMLLNIVTENADDDGQSANDVIDNAQAVEIDLKLTELQADKPAFLKYMKADSVPNILAKDYDKAVKAIAAKAKKAGKQDA